MRTKGTRWTLKGFINPDLCGTLYRNNLKYLMTEAVGEVTPYGRVKFCEQAHEWAKAEMKDKRKCLKSLIKRGRYIIVKNHDRWIVYLR